MVDFYNFKFILAFRHSHQALGYAAATHYEHAIDCLALLAALSYYLVNIFLLGGYVHYVALKHYGIASWYEYLVLALYGTNVHKLRRRTLDKRLIHQVGIAS